MPPGPWRLPIIGNLHQLALAASLPDQALQKLVRKYGPLMHLQLGEISTLVVSSPKMAMEMMKTHDVHFVQRPQLLAPQFMVYGATDIAFAPYGDYWRQIRKICTLELLSAKRVQSFSHIRQDENKKLIQSIHSSAGSPIDLSGKLFSLLGTTVSRAAFGKENDDQDEFMSLVRKAITMTGGFEVDDMFPSLKPLHLLTRQKAKVEHVHQRADKILEDILRKHMEKRTRVKEGNGSEAEQEDLVDVLLRLKESGSLEVPMTMENIKAVIWVSKYYAIKLIFFFFLFFFNFTTKMKGRTIYSPYLFFWKRKKNKTPLILDLLINFLLGNFILKSNIRIKVIMIYKILD